MISCALLLASCSAQEKSAIRDLLDARDAAVSRQDLQAYAALLLPGYDDRGQSEFEIINRMRRLFARFDHIDMRSSNRTIRLLDSNHAECEQSYQLQVEADGIRRQLNQRERISLTKTEQGWKISGGL
jgi:ketosteroid isomerase-like protein